MVALRLSGREGRKELTPEEVQMLFDGFDFFRTFRSDEHRRRVWRENRGALMQMWFEDEENLGRRPWGWWRFDARELRRRVGGSGRAVMDDEDCPAWARKTSFGEPAVFAEYDPDDPPRFESQLEYLQRHELLTEEEQERLASPVIN
jgi:hypothetical protein